MNKKCMYMTRNLSLVVLAMCLLSSCMSTKKVPYFLNKDEIDAALTKHLHETKIMPKDILQIRVFSSTPGAGDQFNLAKTPDARSITSSVNLGPVYDYVVDNDGIIDFPIIGEISVGGLTQNEAEKLIKSKVTPYMAEKEHFIVHVNILNCKYSVLGEVRRPGLYTTQSEKTTILDAIAQAGDLTLYGMRDKVYLIREDSQGQKEFHMLDLNDANIISSPYYYLQQNDVIYVEPNKAQARSSYFSSTSSMWLSVVSALTSISTLIIAITK